MSATSEFTCQCGHVEQVPIKLEVLQNYEGRAVFVCPACGNGQDFFAILKEVIAKKRAISEAE